MLYDQTEPQLVPKLLLQVSVRELHNSLVSDPNDDGVSVESPPVLFSIIFRFPLIVTSSLIPSVISMTKILLGVPLFSLFFLVYARIRISTIEVKANTQQVLAV